MSGGSSGVKLLCYRTNWQLSMLHEGKQYCVIRLGPLYFIMSKCKAVKHVETYLSPVDIEEFRTGILGAWDWDGACIPVES